jgi:hypothetical protein
MSKTVGASPAAGIESAIRVAFGIALVSSRGSILSLAGDQACKGCGPRPLGAGRSRFFLNLADIVVGSPPMPAERDRRDRGHRLAAMGADFDLDPDPAVQHAEDLLDLYTVKAASRGTVSHRVRLGSVGSCSWDSQEEGATSVMIRPRSLPAPMSNL